MNAAIGTGRGMVPRLPTGCTVPAFSASGPPGPPVRAAHAAAGAGPDARLRKPAGRNYQPSVSSLSSIATASTSGSARMTGAGTVVAPDQVIA